jgi:hypothetical protein
MPLIEFDDARIGEELWRVGGAFIQRLQRWTWWVTLTFRDRVSAEHADNSFRDWAKYLARDLAADHVGVVWVREDRPHVHFHTVGSVWSWCGVPGTPTLVLGW